MTEDSREVQAEYNERLPMFGLYIIGCTQNVQPERFICLLAECAHSSALRLNIMFAQPATSRDPH